ncbi:spindle assembly checkpoint component MAD1 [Culex quinquefasciatus]|uniref:spindle assembly checkpoint component MAD1 n=1 Tax=Culex quinquefasciatus TaxID=7176 RepID=UPI0018E31E46|nr:spindle assembly checkpoint component MAD1 [Culex quinquefasciatus]
MSSPKDLQLDPDLQNTLKEAQNLVQNLISTKTDLKAVQLELKISKSQLESMKQQVETNNRGANSDWNRFSKSLNNIIKVIGDRKDISDYERTIQNLTQENESLKQQLASSQANHEAALERERLVLKEQIDRETARLAKQISELLIDKELAASAASIRYDKLQSQLDCAKEQHEERRAELEAKYEQLLQTLTDQKAKLREENAALKQREAHLQDQLEQMQNRSTDFLLGRGQKMAPIGASSSQRYGEVVETVPVVSSRRSGGINVEESAVDAIQRNSAADVVEVSSSSGRSMTSRTQLLGGSPQHPGSGGHVTKPRKRRKLFNQTAEGC